jgi:hypothetical protein
MFPDPSGLVAERVMKHRINISALSKVSLNINIPLILIVREVCAVPVSHGVQRCGLEMIYSGF